MGSLCSCLTVRDAPQDLSILHSVDCKCPRYFLHNMYNKYRATFHQTEEHAAPSTTNITPTFHPQQVMKLPVPSEKCAGTTSKGKEALIERDNESSPSGGSKDFCSKKLSSHEGPSQFSCAYTFSDDEDVCPTCLDGFDHENPEIVAECNHYFHLSCIYEWMERSEKCAVCSRVMVFSEVEAH